jgi:hypothetical protein
MKQDHLKYINQLASQELESMPDLHYYQKTYKPIFKVLYFDENTKQAILCFVQPKLLKKSKINRAQVAQLFSFFVYSEGKFLPSRSQSRFGKDQTLAHTIERQGDNVHINYFLNGQAETICLSIVNKECNKLLQPADFLLEPDFTFFTDRAKGEINNLSLVIHILFSRFLTDLLAQPKKFGIEEIKITMEDSEYKRGYLLFMKSRNQACDILIKKDLEKNPGHITQVRLIGQSTNYSKLGELEKKFQKYIRKYSIKRLKALVIEF